MSKISGRSLTTFLASMLVLALVVLSGCSANDPWRESTYIRTLYVWDGAAWVQVIGGGSGDITAVGDVVSGAAFASGGSGTKLWFSGAGTIYVPNSNSNALTFSGNLGNYLVKLNTLAGTTGESILLESTTTHPGPETLTTGWEFVSFDEDYWKPTIRVRDGYNPPTTVLSADASGVEVTGNLWVSNGNLAVGSYTSNQSARIYKGMTGSPTTWVNVGVGADAVSGDTANWYGMVIEAPGVLPGATLTNKYALVTWAGAGNVGIGTTTPSTALDVNGVITSEVATGTAPFVVASTTKVANLNADLVDGYQTGRSITYVVAASDSKVSSIAQADYVADGVADDVQIQAALTAGSGGRIILMEGTYNAAAQITVPANTILEGQGYGTLIGFTGDIQGIISLGQNSVAKDLRVRGNDTGVVQTGIDMPGADSLAYSVWVEHVGYDGFLQTGNGSTVFRSYVDTTGDDGINPYGNYAPRIIGNHTKNTAGDGIHISEGVVAADVEYNYVEAWGTQGTVYGGINIGGAATQYSATIVGNIVIIPIGSTAKYGIYPPPYSTVSDNYIEIGGGTANASGITGNDYSTYTGNVIRVIGGGDFLGFSGVGIGSTATGNTVIGAWQGFRDTSSITRNSTFSLNTIYQPQRGAIWIQNADGYTLVGNKMLEVNTDVASGIAAVQLIASTGNIISDNVATQTVASDVRGILSDTSSSYTASGNDFSGVWLPFGDDGTGAIERTANVVDASGNLVLYSSGSTKISKLTSNGFVKTGSGDGTLSVDTSVYLTAEADTLATVTGRGASTSTQVSLNGGIASTGDLVLSPTSKVGISVAPVAKLDVDGAATSPTLRIRQTNGGPWAFQIYRTDLGGGPQMYASDVSTITLSGGLQTGGTLTLGGNMAGNNKNLNNVSRIGLMNNASDGTVAIWAGWTETNPASNRFGFDIRPRFAATTADNANAIIAGWFQPTLDATNTNNLTNTFTGALLGLGVQPTANSGATGTVTEAVGLYSRALFGSAAGATLSNFKAVEIDNGSGNITNYYGVYFKALTVGVTKNTEIYFGDTTPTIEIANAATLSITDGTNTLLSLADNGTTGILNISQVGTLSGALTLQPTAGSNLNVSLSTTGDFAVNTNQLYVDTSTGYVGIGDATPLASLTVGSGDLFQVNSSGVVAASGSGTHILTGTVQTSNVTTSAGDLVIDPAGNVQWKEDGTGAGTPLLGANSPATVLAAPYTWITFKSSDGTTVYVPAWK